MTKEEATTKANELNKSATMPFCPLINGQCQKSCTCWQEATPYEVKVCLDGGTPMGHGQYEVTWLGCNNSMFTGNRECNTRY